MSLIASFLIAVIYYFVMPILTLLVIAVFISVILSWLINFNVINGHNQFVATIWRLTNAVTEPLLRPIRNVLPPLGGLDLSPIVLLLLIQFIRGWVIPVLIVTPLASLQ